MRVQRAMALGIRYWYINSLPGYGFVYVHRLRSRYVITKSHNQLMGEQLIVGNQIWFSSIHALNKVLEDL